MLGNLIITVAALFAFGAMLITLTHRLHSLEPSQRKTYWLKYKVYAAIVVAIMSMAYVGRWLIAVILLIIAIAAGVEIKQNLRKTVPHSMAIAFPSSLMIEFSLGHLLISYEGEWFSRFAFVFLLVAISDSYSQLWGKLLGSHKLCPRLSPGKTWGGFLGGLFSVIAGAYVFRFLVPNVSTPNLMLFSVVIALASVAGDLTFSFIKRRIGIKDFSGVLPGHGGVLDRFDSLIIASPVSYWLGRILLK